MEHVSINHEIAKEYQAEHDRKSRFDKWSNDERFYLETFDGGILLKNYFLAHKHHKKEGAYLTSERDYYFLLKREGCDYRCMLAVISETGISINFYSGKIYREFQFLESHVSNCEFLEPEQYIKNLESSINKHFHNFKINI